VSDVSAALRRWRGRVLQAMGVRVLDVVEEAEAEVIAGGGCCAEGGCCKASSYRGRCRTMLVFSRHLTR
jgi:hypothetical protein